MCDKHVFDSIKLYVKRFSINENPNKKFDLKVFVSSENLIKGFLS